MSDQLSRQVGARIRLARRKRAITQERLAELLDRSPEAISNIERGVSSPSLRTLAMLADAIDAPLSELLDIGPVHKEAKARRRIDLEGRLRELVDALSDDGLEALLGHGDVVQKALRRVQAQGRIRTR